MADRPWTMSVDKLDAFVKSLPDDKMRLSLLQALSSLGGRAPVRDLARMMSGASPGDAASVILAAAKDGLVQLTDDNNSVRMTELGAKLAERQAGSTY